MCGLSEIAASGIELCAASIIVGGIVYGLVRHALIRATRAVGAYRVLEDLIGSSPPLGLELLVAAAIIRTGALDPTLMNIATLGVVVAIRTFLGRVLQVEAGGRWSWNARSSKGAAYGSL